MQRVLLLVAFFGVAQPGRAAVSAPAATPLPPPQQASSYYVYSGLTLQFVAGDATRAPYATWQVWLYPQSVSALQTSSPSRSSGSALAYTRWGVLEGPSARAVLEQLAAWQNFERAYRNLFGPAAWGRFTFSYPVEPIAVAPMAIAKQAPSESSDLVSKISFLNGRLSSLVATLCPSLENSEPAQFTPLLRGYLDQVRNILQEAAHLSSDLGRLPADRFYLSQELARLNSAVTQAENAVPQVRAALPTVKLPASNAWMTHVEQQGSEGAVEVRVVEVGSAAWVQQSWSGGDGSMAGTVAVTILPYQDIGNLDVLVASLSRNHGWTLRIGSSSPNGFPQSLSSPERKTATRTYAAVDLKTADRNIYLEFPNPSDAQDAYTFFLYHKQRGR